MAEKLSHIFYEKPYQSSKFSSVSAGSKNGNLTRRDDRKAHSQKLYEQFEKAWNEAVEKK